MASNYDSLLANLHPTVQPLARMFLEEAAAAGLDPRVQETYRSRDRQAKLYAQGRTAPGAIVTKAGPGQSNHNYGVAFDVVPGSVIGKPNWAPEDEAWTRLGEIGRKHGLEWGGDWKFVDKPHFQLAGANWRKLQNDPEFAKFSGGDGHNHGPVAVASAAPTAAPPLEPPRTVGSFPVAQAATPQGPQMAFGDVVVPQQPASFTNFIDSYNRRRQAAEEEEQARQSRLAALFATLPA